MAILMALLPVLVATLTQLLPTILTGIVNRIFNPMTPIQMAKRDVDSSLASGDLTKIGQINTTVIQASGQADLTQSQINDMTKLIGV